MLVEDGGDLRCHEYRRPVARSPVRTVFAPSGRTLGDVIGDQGAAAFASVLSTLLLHSAVAPVRWRLPVYENGAGRLLSWTVGFAGQDTRYVHCAALSRRSLNVTGLSSLATRTISRG
jgi:hypothetical protein